MSPFSTVVALLSAPLLASALPSVHLNGRQNIIPFDPAQQYVSNKGDHAFIAPGPNDMRSPCPALNVMANHGYIPRNGFVTLLQMEQALPQVFGLSTDLTSVLNLIFLGAKNGSGDAFNIGGFSSSTLLGVTPRQFIQTYDIGTINAADPMQQVCTNYKAINGSQYTSSDPVSQVGALNDELFFRAFANKSAEYPLGSLDDPTKLTMLAMTPNNDGTFTWKQYYNAIPDNWYKNNVLASFNTATFVLDVLELELLGCAPGLSNLFSSTNVAMLTNGAYTNADLQDSNTAMCFLTQAAPLVLPTLANQAIFNAATRKGVSTAVTSIQKNSKNLKCATVMKSINLSVLGDLLGLQL